MRECVCEKEKEREIENAQREKSILVCLSFLFHAPQQCTCPLVPLCPLDGWGIFRCMCHASQEEDMRKTQEENAQLRDSLLHMERSSEARSKELAELVHTLLSFVVS